MDSGPGNVKFYIDSKHDFTISKDMCFLNIGVLIGVMLNPPTPLGS